MNHFLSYVFQHDNSSAPMNVDKDILWNDLLAASIEESVESQERENGVKYDAKRFLSPSYQLQKRWISWLFSDIRCT